MPGQELIEQACKLCKVLHLRYLLVRGVGLQVIFKRNPRPELLYKLTSYLHALCQCAPTSTFTKKCVLAEKSNHICRNFPYTLNDTLWNWHLSFHEEVYDRHVSFRLLTNSQDKKIETFEMAENSNGETPENRTEVDVVEDCLEIDENVSLDDDSGDNMSLCSNNSDLCIVFDNKDEQKKSAVEVVLDSDEDTDIISVQSVQDNDYIPLQSHQHAKKHTREVNTGCSHHTSTSRDDGQPSVSNLGPISDEEVEKKREQLEEIRTWSYTNLGATLVGDGELNNPRNQIFTVMTYNVLAQCLLESHPYLYTCHDQRALSWEHRSKILFKELKMANPDILCIQEVQTSHLDTFYKAIQDLGYGVIHKQRTGNKGDGVAIYYKESMFCLKESTTVEFFQPGIPILNRDNVAIVAKLMLKNDPQKRSIVIATTHLLFNPKRHDIKLAQVQILLAEVERFSYLSEDRRGNPVYCPAIITGDMNFEPFSGVYELLTNGELRYEGLSSRTLTFTEYGNTLDRELIPHNLEITDTCQHYSIVSKRPTTETYEIQQQGIKLYHSESQTIGRCRKNQFHSFDEYVKEMVRRGCVNNFTPNPAFAEAIPPPSDATKGRYGTGQLSHKLNLRSVYNHGPIGTSRIEVTTKQKDWVTVDYIFYSCKFSQNLQKVIEGDLKLISRLKLPRANEAERIGPIPNPAIPSDHFPLAAVFFLK